MALTYHGTLTLSPYKDQYFHGVILTMEFHSGKSVPLCAYIGSIHNLLIFLKEKKDGDEIRLDGFSEFASSNKGHAIDHPRTMDILVRGQNRAGIIEALDRKSSMILRWKRDELRVISINTTDESEVNPYEVNASNVFNTSGLCVIHDYLECDADELYDDLASTKIPFSL